MQHQKSASQRKNDYFNEIDQNCEPYKQAIEEAYMHFSQYKSEAKESVNSGIKHTAILTLFNAIFQNYIEILFIRNGITKEDYYSPKTKNNEKDKISIQLEVFYNKQQDIEESFFNFSVEKRSGNQYPYFVYLDNLLRPHLESAKTKEKIEEVKGGVRFSGFQTRLMSDLFRFLDSYYNFLDYDRISDDVLAEFIESENAKRKQKLTLERVKQLYIALRTHAKTFDVEQNDEGDEGDEDFDDCSEEDNAEEFCEEDGAEDSADEEHFEDFEEETSEDDDEIEEFYVNADKVDDTFFANGFENAQLIYVLDKCENELKKEKKKFQKYISFQLTAHLLNMCVVSLKISDESYAAAISENFAAVNAFIESIKKYSFASEEIINLFIIKKDKVLKKEIAEMLKVTDQTLRNHFGPFTDKIGLVNDSTDDLN